MTKTRKLTYLFINNSILMIPTLNKFDKVINKSGNTITLTYCHYNFSGTCTYQEVTTKGLRKPIEQSFLVLVSTDMGDVIEYRHKETPLMSGDLLLVDKDIRDHSLQYIKEWLVAKELTSLHRI
tara:strand:- start:833 stop:1204 length:372 start_codon:yes stop_codon:yes gene_type:complete